jgi:hypothetical protein
MTGKATVTDEVFLEDGRHVILSVKYAHCETCKISLADGQYMALDQHFDWGEAPGSDQPPVRWFEIECPECHSLVNVRWADQHDFDIDWHLHRRHLDDEGGGYD